MSRTTGICRHCQHPVHAVAVDEMPLPPSVSTDEAARKFREEARADVGDTVWIADSGRISCPSESFWHDAAP